MHATIRTSPPPHSAFYSLRPLLLLLTVIGALVLPAATAKADQVSAPVTGFLDDGSTFDGTFRVNRFRSTRLGVVASGLLIGTVTGVDGKVTDVISNRLIIAVADMSAGSNCEVLTFAMDQADLVLLDFTVHTDSFDMIMSADSANLGNQLCAIADGFRTGRFTAIASSLNAILDVLAKR